MNEEKVKIIYISGHGHSGSTLLNIILGASENAFGVGEVMHIKNRLKNKNLRGKPINPNKNLCDCGELQKCPLWSNVKKSIKNNELYINKTNIKTATKLFFKPKAKIKKNFDDEKLYSTILREANEIKPKTKIIIDSSKNFQRMLYLINDKHLDVNVIHLTRDGRATVHAMQKPTRNKKRFWLKTYLIWTIENMLEHIFLKTKHKEKTMFLSYDLFAKDPDKYIKRINEQFGLEIDENKYLENVNKEEFHNFSGNGMRKRKITEIKHDERWRKEMPKWKQVVLSVLCYIPNKLWVYNKKLE